MGKRAGYRIEPAEGRAVASIAEELALVRLDQPSSVGGLMPAMRALVQLDNLVMFSPVQRPSGWHVERFHSDRVARADELERRFLTFLASAPRRYAWYDALHPEPEQRDRVIDALDIIPPGELEASQVYRDVLAPMGFHRHRQPRVLVCDGASLLAWFGAFHAGPVDARHRALLGALIAPVQARLAIERRLAGAPGCALEAALEALGSPAFVVGPAAQIYEANASARVLLETRGAEVHAALHAVLAGGTHPLGVELVALREPAGAERWLAIVRPSADERIAACVARAGLRWSLSPRKREVLAMIVRGEPTTTIAADLGTSERSVELHVTSLFERAGVANRTALVARVLLEPD